jgi:glycerol-3-phosphate dehydrogenase
MNTTLSYKERQRALADMTRDGLDVLIIGGGITGCGVLLEAAARGLRAGLIDKADFASGTSSKSTKLAHGGIRYLAHFDFGLVYEALIERGRMIRNAPHLVKPLGFVLPLYKENRRPLDVPIVPPGGVGLSLIMQAGLLMYDIMSGKLGIKMHQRLNLQKALEMAPCLKTEGLTSAFIYYDAQTDDTLLTMNVLRTAVQFGARMANYVELIGFDQETERGKITAARVRDVLTGDEHQIRVGAVINAGGVFAGRIEAMAGESKISIKPAKGVHLTVPREVLGLGEFAAVLPETPDGRLIFLVPWNTRVTIGTTDSKGGDIDNPTANDDDIDYLLNTTNLYLKTKLNRNHIISNWAGYRPLISPSGAQASTSKLSRTHVVNDGPGGMITITGGKLTTYRRMAQDTLDHLVKRQGKAVTHPTTDLPLDGADRWQEAAAKIDAVAGKYDWSADVVKRIKQYGSEALKFVALCDSDMAMAKPIVPDLPYVMAEVAYACRYEMAMRLDDVITRRLHLNFEDWARGVDAAPAIAKCMSRELGWSVNETEAQLHSYIAKAMD